MITCDSGSCELSACCDCCRHYDFNGAEEGAYIGKGWCRLREVQMDPGDECEQFHCFRVVLVGID